MKKADTPTLENERRLWQSGYLRIAGIDEAGRGALAGPVVAAAVVLSPHSEHEGIWAQVRDSKLLKVEVREQLADEVRAQAHGWAVGQAEAGEIDAMGIGPATRLAMHRALAALDEACDYLLIDWVRLDRENIPQKSFIKGDQRIVSIAAASILAKTHRDRLLRDLDQHFPDYEFARHKGYATLSHRQAIERFGPCIHHRHSFAPIRTDPTLFD